MHGRISHSEETRTEAASYFSQGYGFHAVATYMGLPSGTMREWLDSYRQGRLLNFDLVRENRSYPQQLKVAAVEKFLAGTPKPEILLEFGISTRTLFNKWVLAYRKDGPAGLTPKPKGRKPAGIDGESLEEKVSRLEMENALLKKYQALVIADQAAQPSKRKQSHC